MKKISLMLFLFLLSFSGFAQDTRKPLSSEELELREKLENDNSILQITCDRKISAETQKTENSNIRLAQYKAFQLKEKTAKTKKRCSTIEGTPIVSYLMVDNGEATLIIDSSRDRFGQMRVNSYKCNELNIGLYFFDESKKQMVFQKIDSEKTEGNQIFLQCETDKDEIVF